MSVIVSYCDKYYSELADKSKTRSIAINDLVKDIAERSTKTKDEIFNMSSIYETLAFDRSWPSDDSITQTNTRFVNRFYIDIEKLPIGGSKGIVDNIANDIIAYVKDNLKLYKFVINDDKVSIDTNNNVDFNDVKTDYVITYNRASSSHYGDSYHVIFPHVYIYHVEQVKSFMNDFISKHRQYIDYVDLSVYSTRRLFRLPFSKNVTNSYNYNKTINSSDIHKPITGDNYIDYIIQYVQPDGHIIVLNRTDPINFVQRIKQSRTSGTLPKNLIKVIDSVKTDTTSEEKPTSQQPQTTEEKPTKPTNDEIIKEVNDINNMIKQLMERQQKLMTMLGQE